MFTVQYSIVQSCVTSQLVRGAAYHCDPLLVGLLYWRRRGPAVEICGGLPSALIATEHWVDACVLFIVRLVCYCSGWMFFGERGIYPLDLGFFVSH